MNKLEYIFFPLGVIVILAHLARNISGLYYIFVAIILFGFITLSFLFSQNIRFQKTLSIILILFTYVITASFLADGSDSISIGVARLFYLSPIILYFFSKEFSRTQSINFWKIILWFVVASSCTILLQYIIGPISWFADHSGRAGTDRFASLAGSLTVYGSLVGVAIILSKLIYLNYFIYLPVLFILCLGALLSLQKMAFFSVALSVLIAWIGARDKISIHKSLLLLLFAICTAFALYHILIDYFPGHFSYVSLIFTSDAFEVGDVSVGESIVDRMTHLPLEAFSHWDHLNRFFGVGVFGGSGGLGYPDLPMAHNLIAEIFLIFGVVFGFLIVVTIFKYLLISLKLLYLSSDVRIRLASSSFLIIVLTSFFSGGLFYQPVTGLIFWFSFSELYKLNRNVKI
jgi:hypothetical protein